MVLDVILTIVSFSTNIIYEVLLILICQVTEKKIDTKIEWGAALTEADLRYAYKHCDNDLHRPISQLCGKDIQLLWCFLTIFSCIAVIWLMRSTRSL